MGVFWFYKICVILGALWLVKTQLLNAMIVFMVHGFHRSDFVKEKTKLVLWRALVRMRICVQIYLCFNLLHGRQAQESSLLYIIVADLAAFNKSGRRSMMSRWFLPPSHSLTVNPAGLSDWARKFVIFHHEKSFTSCDRASSSTADPNGRSLGYLCCGRIDKEWHNP